MPDWVTSKIHRDVVSGLRDIRKEAGLTQRDLAAKLGKPPSYVAKIEGVERNLSITEFLAWCEAVGVESDEFLSRLK